MKPIHETLNPPNQQEKKETIVDPLKNDVTNHESDRWFLIGDLHGVEMPIENFYEKNKAMLSQDPSKNHIILLGDFGANYALKGQRDHRFKTALSQYPFTYIALRGNHEARAENVQRLFPDQWETIRKYGGQIYREKAFPQIEYLSDSPAVYYFCEYKTLSIPGAYSIDKNYRLYHGLAWFEDEQLSAQEMDLGRQIVSQEKSFDLVISHTCPSLYEPVDLFLSGIDQSTVDKTMERYLGELEFALDYKRWAWGHFHADRLYPWNNGKQMLMLFNECVVDLKKFMEMGRNHSLEDILAVDLTP